MMKYCELGWNESVLYRTAAFVAITDSLNSKLRIFLEMTACSTCTNTLIWILLCPKKRIIRSKQQDSFLNLTTVRFLSEKEILPVQFTTNQPPEIQDERHSSLKLKWANARDIAFIKLLQRVDATGDVIWFFDKTFFGENAHFSSPPKTPQTSPRKI
jgi:hypothetical protein